MARITFVLLNVCIFLLAGSEVYEVQSVTQRPVFLQVPQRISHFVSRDLPANVTWAATNVCKMQIRCNGKRFEKGEKRVCGKTCNRCKTRKRTKIITFSDFPKNVRSMTCQCKLWGRIAVRSEKTIVEKAFLRRKFRAAQLKYVAFPNTTVILQCSPPDGSPSPSITWFKNGEPLFARRGRRLRVTPKKDLVIKRLRRSDSGFYQCIAENMAALREGPVMTLEVRENTTAPVFNESQLLCANLSSVTCSNGSNASSGYEFDPPTPPMLVVGTQDGLTTVDLRNRSTVTRYKAAKNVVSLDVGSDPDLIYWTDKKRISKFFLHSGVSEEMPFRLDLDSSVESVAVDWVSRKVYWTDTMRGAVYFGDVRNGGKVRLIKDKLDFPGAIVLSPRQGIVYWTDWGRTPKIERARLDGTERTTFITSGIQSPNALALDESNKILYWAGTDENKYGVIEAVTLDGLNRKVIFYHRGYHPSSLDVDEDFVYWSDLGKNAVFRINKTNGRGEETIVDGLDQPMGLKILHGREESRGPNSCDENNGGCAYLCLPLTFPGRQKCFCKEGYKLKEDGKNCDEIKLQGEGTERETGRHPGTPLVSLIITAILLLFAVIAFVCALKKYFSRSAAPPRMPRDDREENRESDDESLVTDHTDLMPARSRSQQICADGSSGANAIGEDPPVRPSAVHYTTNMEQHGGVTVVGDGANINHHHHHHHYPTQN